MPNVFDFIPCDTGLKLIRYNGNLDTVKVPHTVENLPVTEIDDDAFAGSSFSSITLPKHLISIGLRAFYSCRNLESIKIPNSVTSIQHLAFENCVSLTNIQLPKGLTILMPQTFRNCNSLEQITLPETLETIEYSAFLYCTALKSIHFPPSLKTIAEYSFLGCNSLTEITLPNTLETVKKNAFAYCSILEKVTASETINFSHKNIFSDSFKLSSVNLFLLPILSISQQLNCINFFFNQWHTLTEEDKKVLISIIKRRPKLKKALFLHLKADYINLLISEKVKISLDEIDYFLSNSIEKKSPEMTAIFLDYKEKNFSQQTIDEHENQKDLVEIGLEYPTFKKLREKWIIASQQGEISISGYKGNGEEEVIPHQLADGKKITILRRGDHNSFRPIKKLIIEAPLKYMAPYTFTHNTLLEEIVLPDTLTEIPENICAHCYRLEKVYLPDSITKLAHGAFVVCTSLEEITLPQNLESISTQVFAHCGKLKHIRLPDSLITIGMGAFYQCNSLEEIKFPANLELLDKSAFCGCENLTKITFQHINQKFYLGQCVFQNCSALTEVTLPEPLQTIPSDCFASCTNLEKIHLGTNVTQISRTAFAHCVNLTTVNIPPSLTYVAPNAFHNCPKLDLTPFKPFMA